MKVHSTIKIPSALLKYYKLLAKGSGAAASAAQQAFAGNIDPKLGSFPEAVQIMLGGDEVYVATHPLFAQYVPTIIGELDKASYVQGRTIDMRCSTALSGAKTVGTGQRLETQLSHQEAMKLAELAPGTLKEFERTRRRIERLIDVIEWNPKKKVRGPGYRQELDAIPLKQLYARLKNKAPQRLTPDNFARLLAVLQAEDLDGAENRPEFELVDFTGKIVEQETLRKAAQGLEDKVRLDVGRDNVRVQPPPAYNVPTKMPKWVEDLIDIWYP